LSTVTVNRFSIPLGENLAGAERCLLKYCEECRELFVSQELAARFPGDFTSFWHSSHRRPPQICAKCKARPFNPHYMEAETRVMNDVAREMRAARDKFQPTSLLRNSKREFAQAQERSEQPRKHIYAKWREPLMRALLEKQEMTAREMAVILGADLTNPVAVSNVPVRVRSVGINIVVVRRERRHTGHGLYNIRLYGLSSSPTPEPLTPPQDEETHQFMREVKEPN
jgi:hypothetical protein